MYLRRLIKKAEGYAGRICLQIAGAIRRRIIPTMNALGTWVVLK
jgi:hypothetical protein